MAALGRGRECHCGFLQHGFTLRDTVPTDKCNVPCGGANELHCGGDAYLSVYQTTVEGSFGFYNLLLLHTQMLSNA